MSSIGLILINEHAISFWISFFWIKVVFLSPFNEKKGMETCVKQLAGYIRESDHKLFQMDKA